MTFALYTLLVCYAITLYQFRQTVKTYEKAVDEMQASIYRMDAVICNFVRENINLKESE